MNERSRVLHAFLTAVPADLQPEVQASFLVPQCGPYHREGRFLESHLVLVLGALEAIQRGEFHPSVPESLRAELQRVANIYAALATMYVLLHDIDKGNCLTLKFADGREDQVITWDEWQKLVNDYPLAEMIWNGDEGALDALLEDRQIIQISYFQKVGDSARMHGRVAAERLRARGDIPEVVCRAVDTHEAAYQFGAKGGVNIPLFRKVFADMSDDELLFALVVNLADEMGSHGESGPDISAFLLLAETAIAAKKFTEVEARLRASDVKLDEKKLDAALAKLFKATDAFRGEDVDVVYARIAKDCAIPSYSEPRLREALSSLVTDGTLAADLLEPLVSGLIANGAIPSEVGKQLGAANKSVRAAIATAIMV